MKNKNAFAAWVASHVVIAVEQLVQTYLHRQLGPFWANEVAADTTSLVLLIGKDGIRGALVRLAAAVKALWNPAAAAAAPAGK